MLLEQGAGVLLEPDVLPGPDRPELDQPELGEPLERDPLPLLGLPPDPLHERQPGPELALRLGPGPPSGEVWEVAVVQVGPRGRWVTQP